ncbi:hypothetical protein CPAR01_06183 [Colletotrichum paranaense]|uniref:Uncharacterized protein n=1 Tax=Colletotrichum paranaense TaxID=1914294 RepID=A0ABQ9SUV7_9PEZI|nr:uncharacterized protein CPAR01_06183 [Colletotrichum paranaense]KAK1542796.1 hypothetical protein CPAR01_06183 [Colletotrichum paranaense]
MPIPHVLLLLLMQQPLSLPPRLGSSSLPPPPLLCQPVPLFKRSRRPTADPWAGGGRQKQ